jgi:hypothetical protein
MGFSFFKKKNVPPVITFDEDYLNAVDKAAGIQPGDNLDVCSNKLGSFFSKAIKINAEDNNNAALILGVAMNIADISLKEVEDHFIKYGNVEMDVSVFYNNCLWFKKGIKSEVSKKEDPEEHLDIICSMIIEKGKSEQLGVMSKCAMILFCMVIRDILKPA